MRAIPRLLLAFSSLSLLAGAVLHGLGFSRAQSVIAHGHLAPPYGAVFSGLWLNASAVNFVTALIFAAIAISPKIATRPLAALLALIPLASAASIYATMGSFPPAHLLLAAGAAALAGGGLLSRSPATHALPD